MYITMLPLKTSAKVVHRHAHIFILTAWSLQNQLIHTYDMGQLQIRQTEAQILALDPNGTSSMV